MPIALTLSSCKPSYTGEISIETTAIELVCLKKSKIDTWEIFCAKYNVSREHPTADQENFYLDCYLGSQECDADIDSAKVAFVTTRIK